jgi:hypothetical protein
VLELVACEVQDQPAALVGGQVDPGQFQILHTAGGADDVEVGGNQEKVLVGVSPAAEAAPARPAKSPRLAQLRLRELSAVQFGSVLLMCRGRTDGDAGRE